MVKLSGFDVISFIKNDDYFYTIPVFLLTNSTSPVATLTAIELGAEEVFIKTNCLRGLKHHVRSILHFSDSLTGKSIIYQLNT